MRLRLEVKQQLGLSRILKVTVGDKSFRTPALLYPSNTYFQQYLTQPFSTPQFPTEIQGYEIDEPLGIISQEKGDTIENHPMPSYFIESKELVGTTSNVEADKLEILSENFPIANISRYSEYGLAALELRLKFYEEKIFPSRNEGKFILEFSFQEDLASLPIITSWILKNQNMIAGIRIKNILKRLGSFDKILKWIFTLRASLPSNLLWIAGGTIFPENFAIATYLGFDLIDLRGVILSGLQGLFLLPEGRFWPRELKNVLCPCKACQELRKQIPFQGTESLEMIRLICSHNLAISVNEIRKIEHHLSVGTLRTFLESCTHYHPLITSILRSVDLKYGSIIASRFPIVNDHQLQCIGPESYVRPEIVNYIERVKLQVTPAKQYPVILLLPCSAKKPYSQSKSHQKFNRVVKRVSKRNYSQIHQVILTSPAGIIPRELEGIFPVKHYDIPVTGHWDAEEIQTTAECLVSWLTKYEMPKGYGQITVVAHMTGGYRNACKVAEHLINDQSEIARKFRFIYTLSDEFQYSASGSEALTKLGEILQTEMETIDATHVENQTKAELSQYTTDEIIIRAILDYQLGKGAGNLIADRGAVIKRGKRPDYAEIMTFDGLGKIVVGRLITKTGFIKLTPRGGELFLTLKKNRVTINAENMQGSTVFKPIFDKIDANVHPGDDVFVLNNAGEYLGVAEILQSSEDVQSAISGIICKIRGKLKTKKKHKEQANLDDMEELGL